MAKVPFKVSARTAKLIGLENFSTEEGAIIELVKNTYDADADNCILIFDLKHKSVTNDKGEEINAIDKQNSKIYIIDNGIGMTDDIITNQWMTIGTDNKLYEHTTQDKGRVKTGAKGIGRFALNRLGLFTNMQTVSKETHEGFEWLVDWRDFDKQGATVSDVEAILTKVDTLDLKQELLTKFSNSNKIKTLIESISFETGTIIEISELNDDWDNDQLKRLFDNLEMLLPPKEQSDFDIDFYLLSNDEEFGRVGSTYYDDFDYKVEARYDKEDDKKLRIVITRNELDLDALENRYIKVFDFEQMKSSPYRLEDFRKKTITINDKELDSVLSKDIDKSLISKVGKFDFTFYFLKNTISDDKEDGDTKKFPYKSFNSANRRSWLKKFGGVKIFRDDFRIRPYGEKGEDWLKLGERQAQSPGGAGQRLGGYRIRPNQIAGTIKISRIHNLSFQDKSGREGIIENDVFELFKNIVKEIISFFEKDRNVIMFHLSELHKKNNVEAAAKKRAQEEAEKINQEQEREQENNKSHQDDQPDNSEDEGYTEREKILAEGVQILIKEGEIKDDELRLLRSLASVGLIISSFAHEVKSLRSRIIPRNQSLLKELKKHLNEEDLAHIDKDDNPFYMIRLMQDEDTKLKHWLDYSLSTLKRDKRERTNLDFKDYFERFKSTWTKALRQRNITLELFGDDENDCIIRAFEVDMDSIFNNLLSNSINALYGFNKDEKKISIRWKKIGHNIEIIFEDNGKGLDAQYKDNPDEIFNLNESSKKDKKGNKIGTGLGLYIVKSIIQEHNDSNIAIVSIEKGFKVKATFKTMK